MSNLQASSVWADPPSIFIRSSMFGSHNPPIPVARVVTVARVASPYSNDRAYQPFFLHALKGHFESRKRLVRKGDLIAVGLQAELARLFQRRESKETQKKDHTEVPDDSDEILSSMLAFFFSPDLYSNYEPST